MPNGHQIIMTRNDQAPFRLSEMLSWFTANSVTIHLIGGWHRHHIIQSFVVGPACYAEKVAGVSLIYGVSLPHQIVQFLASLKRTALRLSRALSGVLRHWCNSNIHGHDTARKQLCRQVLIDLVHEVHQQNGHRYVASVFSSLPYLVFTYSKLPNIFSTP
jgi:hypothetical protein